MQLVLALVAVILATSPSPGAEAAPPLDTETIRAVPVQHDGRWPPLDTVARDIVESVTGRAQFRGYDPVALLLAWTFEPESWMPEPLIEIANAELRGELQLPAAQTVFSYAELIDHTPFIAFGSTSWRCWV